LVRRQVAEGMTESLGLETNVEDADVSLGGDVELTNIQIANPQGFTQPYILELGSARASVDMDTLNQPTVVVEKAEFEGLKLHLEYADGELNFDTIRKRLVKKRKADKQDDAGDGDGNGGDGETEAKQDDDRKFIVRQPVIRDIEVTIDAALPGGDPINRTIKIDELQLPDMGSAEEGGVTGEAIAAVVLERLMSELMQHTDQLPPEIMQAIEEELQQTRDDIQRRFEDLRGEAEDLLQSWIPGNDES
jgi:hypothetical protein